MSSPVRRPSADDLLVLLAVGRTGRYTTAADELGINHTTISRRIAALERAMGGRVLARVGGGWELTELGREALAAAEAVESAVRSLATDTAGRRVLEGVVRISATDGFSAYIAAPAAAAVQRAHPKVAVELVATTRRATQQRSGMDIEVVVGEPKVHRARAATGRLLPGPLRLPGLSGRTRPAQRRGGSATVSVGLLHRLDAAGR